MSNPTIGFIGYGNMAQAIAEGLVAAGAVDGADIGHAFEDLGAEVTASDGGFGEGGGVAVGQ